MTKLNDKRKFVYKPDFLKIHENYDYFHKPHRNDIGLIHLTKPIEFNERVDEIKMQDERFDDESDAKVVLTGWGRLEVDKIVISCIFSLFRK